MGIFKELISEKTIEGLKHLINANFLGIFSPEVEIDPINNRYSFFEGVSLFYEKENHRGFVNIINDCIETVGRTLGYKFEVLLEDKPLGIKYEYYGVSNPPVTIHYGEQKLTKVKIYSFHKIDNGEEVNYDASVHFYFNDTNVLVVSTPDDYSQRVTLKIRCVDQLVKEVDALNLRVVIE